MPHYFFHLYNDETVCDETGQECVTLEDAHDAAKIAISELVAEQIASGQTVDLSHRIVVEDDQGAIMMTVWFGDFFRWPGGGEARKASA